MPVKHYDIKFRKAVIKDFLDGIRQRELLERYDINEDTLKEWIGLFRYGGYEALKPTKRRRYSQAEKAKICREYLEGISPFIFFQAKYGVRKETLKTWLNDFEQMSEEAFLKKKIVHKK
ncbi:MAG: helix-turn-helix domain-containing protein [Candidatus Izemoplasmataceae bacterium]